MPFKKPTGSEPRRSHISRRAIRCPTAPLLVEHGMRLFTIGFTKSTAESFFSRLKASGATKLIDVRLNNVSQLAGFAKRDDLKYFLKAICGMEYQHLLSLAPTPEILDSYKKHRGSWSD